MICRDMIQLILGSNVLVYSLLMVCRAVFFMGVGLRVRWFGIKQESGTRGESKRERATIVEEAGSWAKKNKTHLKKEKNPPELIGKKETKVVR